VNRSDSAGGIEYRMVPGVRGEIGD